MAVDGEAVGGGELGVGGGAVVAGVAAGAVAGDGSNDADGGDAADAVFGGVGNIKVAVEVIGQAFGLGEEGLQRGEGIAGVGGADEALNAIGLWKRLAEGHQGVCHVQACAIPNSDAHTSVFLIG